MKSVSKCMSTGVFTEEMKFITFLKACVLCCLKCFSFGCGNVYDKDNLKRKGLVLAPRSKEMQSFRARKA